VQRLFFFSSRRRHTRFSRDWSSDVCSSDLLRTFWTCISARWKPWASTPKRTTSVLLKTTGKTRHWVPGVWAGKSGSMGWKSPSRSEERRVGKEGRKGEWRKLKTNGE